MITITGSCLASVVGPIEILQEKPNEFNSEEKINHPDMMKFGRIVMTAMQSFLSNHEVTMEARLKHLELHVDQTCRNSETGQTQRNLKDDLVVEMSQKMNRFMDSMSSMVQSFANELQQECKSKIEFAMMKIEEKISAIPSVSKLTESDALSMNNNAKKQSLSGRKNKILSDLSEKLEHKLKNLATIYDLEKQTEHNDKQILSIKTLLQNAPFYQVLNYTKNIHDVLYSFKPVYETFRKVVNNCDIKEEQFSQMERFEQLLQELKVEIDDNGNILTNMFLALEDAEDLLNEKLTPLETLTQHINGQSPQLPTTLIPTGAPFSEGTLRECEDSEFIGGKQSIDVCSAAVKYNKCYMQVVAYHCCRTCTDAGQIPEVGPHRYLTYPRRIKLFGSLL